MITVTLLECGHTLTHTLTTAPAAGEQVDNAAADTIKVASYLVCFLVFELMKVFDSFSLGQETLHPLLHLKHPGSTSWSFSPIFFTPLTSLARFFGCLVVIWKVAARSLA